MHDHEMSSDMEHSGHDHVHHMMNMMHMTFYWGTDVTLLFSSWRTQGYFSYSVALLLIVLFGVLHEALTSYRIKFTTSKVGKLKAAPTTPTAEHASAPL